MRKFSSVIVLTILDKELDKITLKMLKELFPAHFQDMHQSYFSHIILMNYSHFRVLKDRQGTFVQEYAEIFNNEKLGGIISKIAFENVSII